MENTAKPLCGIKREDFQKTVQGKEVDLFYLRNSNGMEVAITNYGGARINIIVFDKKGKNAQDF